MGEISFNYKTNIEPIHQMAFKYLFSDSIEYSFAYQRYVAFSDANILNNPVAITKVATGLISLYDLFIDKETHKITYDFLINFDKQYRNTQGYTKLTEFDKVSKNTHVESGHSAYLVPEDMYLNQENVFLQRYLYANKHEDFSCTGITGHNFSNPVLLKDFWLIKTNVNNIVMYENPIAEKVYFSDSVQVFKKLYNLHRTNHLDILAKDLMTNLFDNHTNIFKTHLVKFAYDFRAYTGNHLFMNKFIHGNIHADISMKTHNKIVDSIEILLAKRPINELVVQPNFNGYMYDDILNYYDNLALSRTHITANNIKSYLLSVDDKKGFYKKEYAVQVHEKVLSHFNIDNFGIMEYKYSVILDTLLAQPEFITLNYYEQVYQGAKFDKKALKFQNLFGRTEGKIGYKESIYDSFGFKGNKVISYTNKPIYIGYIESTANILYETCFVNRDASKSSYFSDIFLKTGGKTSNIIKHTVIGVSKDRVSFLIKDLMTFAYNDRKSMIIHDTSVDIINDRKSMKIYDTGADVIKDPMSFVIQDNALFIQKEGSSSKKIEDSLTGINKDSAYLKIFNQLWLDKNKHLMRITNELFSLDKDSYYSDIFKQGQTFIKDAISVSTTDFDTVIKYNIPSNYINILSNNFAGMIIPLSKTKHQSYIDNINNMVQKVSGNGFLSQNLSMSKIPGTGFIPSLDLFCDKQEFNSYIEYKNIQISKSKIHGFISKDMFVKKDYVCGAVEQSIWAQKSSFEGQVYHQMKLDKKANNGFIEHILSQTLNPKYAQLHNSLFVDKASEICYYDYNIAWADRENVDTYLHSQMFADKEQQQTHLLDCISPIIKSKINTYYDYVIFATRPIRESSLYQQITEVNRTYYDLGIHPDDFGNWTWVYETPDPIEGLGFNIDELLLPENDTRYEDFKSIIFNKETMRPRNPVKELSDTSFIAKYPIKHPLPNYDKIGIEYIDVETSVMKTIFLKFYRIWQSKIYEFGTMSMVQSTKLMLEYMYTWILNYFPLEQLEQALRVFRLIRWYGETSIIQNSQYIINYEYDTLESKLNTGTCLIPNNLDVNDTMIIDAHLGVIKNNPDYFGQRVYVEFYVENKKNTTFIFSLSNTIGSVNIYINDTLIDVKSTSGLNLVYELPYTGDTNVIRIEKEANHNLNNNFFIGNIKVPNGSFKDLTIDFDPTLRAGNKPLNDIAKKMIAFANLYEDKDEAYEIIQKGNLGVGETYKRLMEYWELHHQDKLKGKRLTIKEV